MQNWFTDRELESISNSALAPFLCIVLVHNTSLLQKKRSGAGVVSKPSTYVYKDAKTLAAEKNSGRINKLWIIWPPIIMTIVSIVVVFGERYMRTVI